MGAGIIIICIIATLGTIWYSVNLGQRLNEVHNDNINIRRANEFIRLDIDREVATKELAFKELLSARNSKDLIIEEYETRIASMLEMYKGHKRHAIDFGKWLLERDSETSTNPNNREIGFVWYDGNMKFVTNLEAYAKFANESLAHPLGVPADDFYIASYDKDNTRLEEIKTANDNGQTINLNMIATNWQEELYQKLNR